MTTATIAQPRPTDAVLGGQSSTATVRQKDVLQALQSVVRHFKEVCVMSRAGEKLALESFKGTVAVRAIIQDVVTDVTGPDFGVAIDPRLIRDYLSKRKKEYFVPIALTTGPERTLLTVGGMNVTVVELAPPIDWTIRDSRSIAIPSTKLAAAFQAVQPCVEKANVPQTHHDRVFLTVQKDRPDVLTVWATNNSMIATHNIPLVRSTEPFTIGITNGAVQEWLKAKDDDTTRIEWGDRKVKLVTHDLTVMDTEADAMDLTINSSGTQRLATMDRTELIRNLDIADVMGISFVHVDADPIAGTLQIRGWTPDQDARINATIPAPVTRPLRLVLNVEYWLKLLKGKGIVEIVTATLTSRDGSTRTAIGVRTDDGDAILAPAMSRDNPDDVFPTPTSTFTIEWSGNVCQIQGRTTTFRTELDTDIAILLRERTDQGQIRLTRPEFAALYRARLPIA